jgi:tight adherence protein C
MEILYFLTIAGTVLCAFMLIATALTGERARTHQRIREVTESAASKRKGPAGKKKAARAFEEAVRRVRAKIGLADDERLRRRFQCAGLRDPGISELYFAIRVLGPVAAILVASFLPGNPYFWAVGLAAAAYMAPDFWLERAIKSHRERIRRSLPDSVDLLVICVDAGLGLDQAMLRVGTELSVSHPEINEEFIQINREQRAGKPRMDAWQGVAERTKLEDMAAFAGLLVQTEKFGTPIVRALSTFADGLRQQRRLRAEELAAKTTVKMIFPLVFFIFPSMFIVMLAPAILSIAHALKGLMSP